MNYNSVLYLHLYTSTDISFSLTTGPPIFTALAEKECPICLSEVFEKPVVVNCGHTFCDQCIRLAMAKHKSCPLCNQVLIESLFLSDTSYTRKLTRKNRSPDRTKIQIFSSVGKYVNTTLPIVTKTSKPQAHAPNRKSTISKNLRKTRV